MRYGGLPITASNPPSHSDSIGIGCVTADRKSTRLNSSHSQISYAVFCLKKKNHQRPCPDGLRIASITHISHTFYNPPPAGQYTRPSEHNLHGAPHQNTLVSDRAHHGCRS